MASGRFGGPFPTPGERELYCVAPRCDQESNALAPVPLCPDHLRRVAEYTATLVQERLQEMQDKADAQAAAPTLVAEPGDGAPGWVYILRLGDRVKIGYTGHLPRRLRQVPHEAVLAVVPGSRETERDMLARFSHLRVVGEWHLPGLDLLEYAHDLNRRAV